MAGFLTGEWLLTRCHFDNGGGVVALRALLTATWIFAVTLAARDAIDPDLAWSFSIQRARVLIVDKVPWFGAIVAAAYAAFYARFSSQWNYLANLYNQIKNAQVNGVSDEAAMAQWRAGFIEDAEDLHLATKRMFAPAITAWGREKAVREAYIRNTVGGKTRFDEMMRRARRAVAVARLEHRTRGRSTRILSATKGRTRRTCAVPPAATRFDAD